MEKILTIIIPTFNMEEYLEKCLSSLVMPRNMEDLEVLVVNDGSKDASLKIAREYEAKYPQTFVVIDKENGNYGSCINRGLKEATGKYLKVLDADDSYETETLCDYLDFLRDMDVDLVMSDFLIIDQLKDKRNVVEYNLPVGIIFGLEYLATQNVPYMWMHAVTHRTEKMRRIDYQQQEGISYTDKEFVFYPIAVSETVVYYPHVIYHYLIGREGQSVDNTIWKKNYWMEEKAIKKLITLYKTHENDVSMCGLLFMQDQMKLYISSIYYKYLKQYRGCLPIENLMAFDQWLKAEDLDLYHCVDEEQETAQFRYVQEWRKYGKDIHGYLFHRFLHRILYYSGWHR